MENHQKKSMATFFKRLFNIRQWSDVDRLQAGGSYIKNLFMQLFVYRVPLQTESFEQVMVRLQLSEEDIIKRQHTFFRFFLIFLASAVFLLAYSVYQMYYGTYLGVGLTLSLLLVTLAFAFRYHFWSYQLRVRKLGCTVLEWWKHGVWGIKS